MAKILHKRGTRAGIDAAKAASQLNAGEIYVITDENRLAVGLSSSTYQDYVKAPIVTTWANKPAGNTLTPNVDRFFITDVGVGGSKWYWDGSRYRVVGGQITLFNLPAQTAVNGSTATTDTSMLIDSPTTCKIKAGVIQTGDKLFIEAFLSKPNTVATVGSSTNIRYRFGSTGTSSDPTIVSTTPMSSIIRQMTDAKAIHWTSATSARRMVDFGAMYGSSTTAESEYIGLSSISTVDNFITVTAGLTGGSTPANDTLRLLNFTVTLKTCG